MEIKGKVHCFFEQSGTFKNEFIKLGIPAEDYDIQNNFGETDHVIDLFHQIDTAYEGGASLFDSITKDDLIVAFYPCIYFCSASQMNMGINSINLRKLNNEEKIKKIIERSNNRQDFYNRLIKFCGVCIRNGFRMVFENPWAEQTYLKANFIKPPEVIDIDRTNRGDYFVKPTAFWFWNCEPTNGNTYQKSKAIGSVFEQKQASRAGLCSEERSMISPDYARNWICDFILGKKQEIGQLSLF